MVNINKFIRDKMKANNFKMTRKIKVPEMCQTCKLLNMVLAGWELAFENRPEYRTEIDGEGNFHIITSKRYTWLSPKEIKQGYIDKERFQW